MDPNANLAEQRRIIKHIQTHSDSVLCHECGASLIEHGERLAWLVQTLDEWVMNGGFLPAEWLKAKTY